MIQAEFKVIKYDNKWLEIKVMQAYEEILIKVIGSYANKSDAMKYARIHNMVNQCSIKQLDGLTERIKDEKKTRG